MTIGRGIGHGPDGPVEKDTKTHLVQRVVLDERTLVLLGEHHRRMVERAATCGTVLCDDPARLPLNRDLEGGRRGHGDRGRLTLARYGTVQLRAALPASGTTTPAS